MFLGTHAEAHPEKPAIVSAETGEFLTYRQLNLRSVQLANYLHGLGLRRGDHIALMMENRLCFPEIMWAALRSGLYVTAINRYSTADEAAYIVNDSTSKAVVVSEKYAAVASDLDQRIPACKIRLMVGGTIDGWLDYDTALADQPASPLMEQWLGEAMVYTSGTTGRPKGIKRPLRNLHVDEGGYRLLGRMSWYGFSGETIFLSTAPFYHAAPINYSIGVHFLGGTVIMMERFDAEAALRTIERYRVTHSQWVPTMFVRLLRLPAEVRNAYDLSSLKVAMHGAGPCAIDVKREMIDWWGNRVIEYYGASEGLGSTFIGAEEWLRKPGSIGQSKVSVVHVCDDSGDEVPVGDVGTLYFETSEGVFSYHNDEGKTQKARNPKHPTWYTTGDVGYVDNEGYIFLTDRKAFTIVSGGVNIYPQAIEDALSLYDGVEDVAVIGVPDAEYGEAVKAVIQLSAGVEASDDLKEDILRHLRSKIARYMVPKSIDFVSDLPRLPTGKLYKQKLRAQYWPQDTGNAGQTLAGAIGNL